VVTLAPAAIVLFGKAAWWLPAWLDKLLPHISVEGETMPPSGAPSDDEDVGGDTGEPGPQEPVAPAPV
jgi:hypothetical protein